MMAEAPFSDDDSGPSIKLFSISPTAIVNEENEEQNGVKFISQDEESLVPSDELSCELNGSEKNGSSLTESQSYSEEIEQQISESLDQLTTSSNHKPCNDHNDDESNPDDQYRRKVRVGNHYQARIPKYFGSVNATFSYTSEDTLLWDPSAVNPYTVENFLKEIAALTKLIIPMGTHLRDNEEALYILQQNGHDVEAAFKKLSSDLSSMSTMSVWTEEECKNFENGLVNFGKNFFLIQKNKVTTRKVGELVQFYYLWKKTERYDLFASRIRSGKKKYALNPGISDLMNRYLGRERGSYGSDVQFILADNKKDVAQSDVQY